MMPDVQWAAQVWLLQGRHRSIGYVVWMRSVLEGSLYVYLTLQCRDDLRQLVGDLQTDITALMLSGCMCWMIPDTLRPAASEDEA